MAVFVRLINGDFDVLNDERDFARLVEIYMGWEAADYFNELMDELDRYREEDPDYDK